MNRILLTTAFLAAFTATLHIIGGTIEIKTPLLESQLPHEIRFLLYACWHLVSVTLLLSALAFFISAKNSSEKESYYMARFVSYLWILFGLVFIAIDLFYGGLLMLLTLPQWTLLIPIGTLGLWGCSKNILR